MLQQSNYTLQIGQFQKKLRREPRSGKVGLLGELNCPCFELASGGRTVQVWYDLMVENDGTERPAVNGEGINNGDRVVVTGELKGEGGTHYSKGDFWATAIVVSWTQYKTSLSLPHTR